MNLAAINKLLVHSGQDAVLITSKENIYYFSGFTSEDATLIITASDQFIFTDSRYFIQAGKEAEEFTLFDIQKTSPAEFIKKSGFLKVGFEDENMTFAEYEKLSGSLSSASVTLLGISREIKKIRQIKSDEELKNIKKAAEIADEAFSFVLEKIQVGMSERDVAILLDFYMKKRGAEDVSFETVCASGIRSAMPHGTATDKIIEKGDFVVLDFGCKYKGYCSDMTRTIVMGKASDKQKEIYSVVLEAQLAALLKIVPNAENSAIDKLARDIITKAGYGENFGHALGHSLGLNVHESPTLSPRSVDRLKSGILMTVEPGIYIENFGGVRIEDLVAITYNGYINLTSSPKELIEIR